MSEPKQWINQLKEAHVTLAMLRGSIRGNTPSQVAMANKLQEAQQILETRITIEEALIP
jgi:hypothetical protein